MITNRITHALAGALVPVLVAATVTGCGDDPPTAEERACDAWEDLLEGIANVAQVDLLDDGLDSARAELAGVRDSLHELELALDDAEFPATEAIDLSVSQLRRELELPTSLADAREQLRNLASTVGATARDLADELSNTCE